MTLKSQPKKHQAVRTITYHAGPQQCLPNLANVKTQTGLTSTGLSQLRIYGCLNCFWQIRTEEERAQAFLTVTLQSPLAFLLLVGWWLLFWMGCFHFWVLLFFWFAVLLLFFFSFKGLASCYHQIIKSFWLDKTCGGHLAIKTCPKLLWSEGKGWCPLTNISKHRDSTTAQDIPLQCFDHSFG